MAADTASTSHWDHDPFLKNIRALKSLLSSRTNNAGTSSQILPSNLTNNDEETDQVKIADLERQKKALTYKLEDALKDSQRERLLRASLEKAFDELTANRNDLKKFLDETLDPNAGASSADGVNLKTRILAVEAERIEALREKEESDKQLVDTQSRLTMAQRKIEELLGEAEATKQRHAQQINDHNDKIKSLQNDKSGLESSLAEETKNHKATQEDLSKAKASIQELEETCKTMEEKMKTQAEESSAHLKNLTDANTAVQDALETSQEEKDALAAELQAEREKSGQQKAESMQRTDSLKVEVDRLKSELESKQTDLEQMNGTVADLDKRMEEMKEKYEEEIERLGGEVLAKNVVAQQLKTKMSFLTKSAEEFKNQLKDPAFTSPSSTVGPKPQPEKQGIPGFADAVRTDNKRPRDEAGNTPAGVEKPNVATAASTPTRSGTTFTTSIDLQSPASAEREPKKSRPLDDEEDNEV